MKHLYLILIFICLGCKAQTIKSLYDDEFGAVDGAYYKDTHNDFDKFTGTWKYTNGNTSLTITLEKKTMIPYKYGSNNILEDMLIGEYQYIENGVEKINTLTQISIDLPINNYNILGNIIIGPHSQYCINCGPNDRKVLLAFSDPTCDIIGYDPEMFFERIDSGGIQKLKFRTSHGPIVVQGVTPPCTEYKVPFGEYILIKQ